MGKERYSREFAYLVYEEYKKSWKFSVVDRFFNLPKGTSKYLFCRFNLKTRSQIDLELFNSGLKKCSKCKETKKLYEFYKKESRTNICKNCIVMKQREYYEKNKNKCLKSMKTWASKNKEKVKRIKEKYKHANRKKICDDEAKRRKDNPEYFINWRRKNRVLINKYRAKKRSEDNGYKIKCYLRSRISTIISINKPGSSVRDLGCSIEDLKKYLEKKFYNRKSSGEKMTWENYGVYGWHIDHIKPLSAFDLTDRKQFLEACHYTNLQPLWAEDNLSKSNKISKEFNNA